MHKRKAAHTLYAQVLYLQMSQELRMLLHRSPRQRAYRVHRQEVPVPYNMCNHLLPLPYNMSHQGLHRGQHLMEVSTVLLSMQGNMHLHL